MVIAPGGGRGHDPGYPAVSGRGAGVTGWSPRADGGSVAVEGLGLVLVPRRGGAVGVQDQDPAPPVNHDLVVEPAQKHAIPDGRGPAVGLVPGVVDLARLGGLVAPAG